MFTESNDNHSHDTRHKSLLYKLPTKTSTKWLCIYYYYRQHFIRSTLWLKKLFTMFYTYNSLSRTAVPGQPQPPWWRRAASTNQVTLKSLYLNMKTASIAHFNFRAKWHQQDHCVKCQWSPNPESPTGSQLYTHAQDTIRWPFKVWICYGFGVSKKSHKNNILYMHYHPTETLLYNI